MAAPKRGVDAGVAGEGEITLRPFFFESETEDGGGEEGGGDVPCVLVNPS